MRGVLGVIVGYIAMAAIVFLGLSGAYLALGANGAFRPGVWDPSDLWIAIMIVVGVLSGLVGGWVCVAISKAFRTAYWLMGLVFVLGMANVAMMMNAPAPEGARPETVSNQDAMMKARTPTWVAGLNVLIGMASVYAGARMKKMD